MGCAECDNGWEVRTHPDTGVPYALACKQCRPHLRFIQLNTPEERLQDRLQGRIDRLRRNDGSAI